MNKQQIKELALKNGFKLKQQPDGTEDLNPYVYEFAAALKAEAGRDGFLEGVRQMAENEIGWFGHGADSCANHYHASILAGKE